MFKNLKKTFEQMVNRRDIMGKNKELINMKREIRAQKVAKNKIRIHCGYNENQRQRDFLKHQ